MKKFETLDQATAPDGTVLTLHRHDGAYFIRTRGVELMSTRRHRSEDLLADVACAPLRNAVAPRVIIGGLGLGFTLREALRQLPADAEVVVAELVQAVIDWNMNPGYDLARDALTDPRVSVRRADVGDLLAEAGGRYDAIMLDVDNGAEALTTSANARLYGDDGIRRAMQAVRPGGVVAWWSALADPAFAGRLRAAGFAVEEVHATAYDGGGARHAILVARAPLAAPSRGP